MYILEIESRSKNDAVEKIKNILNYDEKALEIEYEGGILNIFSKKPNTVKVKYDSSLPDEVVIRGITYTMFAKLGVEVEIDYVKDTPENYFVSLQSDEASFIIGKQGKTLDAFQFLLNIILMKYLKNKKRVLIDVADYREKRRVYLQKLARTLANKVNQTGRSYLMEPLNPYERRIVHIELEKDKRVTTESEGNGLYKRVRIIKIDSPEYKRRYLEEFDDEDFA